MLRGFVLFSDARRYPELRDRYTAPQEHSGRSSPLYACKSNSLVANDRLQVKSGKVVHVQLKSGLKQQKNERCPTLANQESERPASSDIDNIQSDNVMIEYKQEALILIEKNTSGSNCMSSAKRSKA